MEVPLKEREDRLFTRHSSHFELRYRYCRILRRRQRQRRLPVCLSERHTRADLPTVRPLSRSIPTHCTPCRFGHDYFARSFHFTLFACTKLKTTLAPTSISAATAPPAAAPASPSPTSAKCARHFEVFSSLDVTVAAAGTSTSLTALKERTTSRPRFSPAVRGFSRPSTCVALTHAQAPWRVALTLFRSSHGTARASSTAKRRAISTTSFLLLVGVLQPMAPRCGCSLGEAHVQPCDMLPFSVLDRPQQLGHRTCQIVIITYCYHSSCMVCLTALTLNSTGAPKAGFTSPPTTNLDALGPSPASKRSNPPSPAHPTLRPRSRALLTHSAAATSDPSSRKRAPFFLSIALLSPHMVPPLVVADF